MKKESTELRKEIQVTESQTNTGNLAEAAKSVYKRYGTNLSEFFRDAYEAEARKQQGQPTDESCRTEAYSS
jgi:hypothetical protein